TDLPQYIKEGIKQCEVISRPPPSHKPFTSRRTRSDRFVPGTRAVWLKNATLWTGEQDGEQVIYGADVLLDGGVIRKVGKGSEFVKMAKELDAEQVQLNGAWVTPGIVDVHSHVGVDAAPSLRGNDDTNSWKQSVQPWLRSIDGFNTHDLAFNLSISGGITAMLILPGSAGNIGGTAYTVKPRWTYENTPESMQVEPPFIISSSSHSNQTWVRTNAWRHIKHACGENPARVYGNTRMDSSYDFRRAYTEGAQLKAKQDRWCSDPKSQKEPFPDDLQWEALADVIRGNVKVNIHCYETTDLNALVRISNEFRFPIAAFHHAHEAYLVPDLLKETFGSEPPAVAIFATNARYKREAYRGSEYAPKILADSGLKVMMKSDHPVLDSRYLVYEAAQAHHYGLNFSHSLSSVTTHSANVMGLSHRIGYVREGYDADVVIWDSFPLSLGATPKQTYIDGIPQIIRPHVVEKPREAQEISPAGEFEEEAREAVLARGDPDLRSKRSVNNVIFSGVDDMFLPGFAMSEKGGNVVVMNGEIACVGACQEFQEMGLDFEMVDLKGGSISPGMITVGSALGMKEIDQESSTSDGKAYDLTSGNAKIVDGILVRGVDGVMFDGKDELLAYRAGVTTAVSYPLSSSLFSGISFSFSTGALHALEEGAILNPSAALHITMSNSKFSISTKIGILRRLLHHEENDLMKVMKQVATGKKRLVVEVNKADVMASLVRLKKEVKDLKMTFLGGQESWMIADQLAEEKIGVIVSPSRSFPGDWDQRRIIPGPPLSNHTLASYLSSAGVLVGLGIREAWEARNTQYEAAWQFTSSPGTFSKSSALALVSENLEVLLGL
ncbi:hypothetical protein TREMEDRAFT_11883, partial [Tremella mesenterica DSM 1558]|uniref:uncharacterized protein n=1 Tax=Tremella mesenterica (strain ATCC 24925 / CBS 8224 / DSM 1558 / NBRC 9311 / NRRL Y-6157 / RJB 2259-6 / UBC 559-6) TaxID=578456 RepID=UPI0003F490AB